MEEEKRPSENNVGDAVAPIDIKEEGAQLNRSLTPQDDVLPSVVLESNARETLLTADVSTPTEDFATPRPTDAVAPVEDGATPLSSNTAAPEDNAATPQPEVAATPRTSDSAPPQGVSTIAATAVASAPPMAASIDATAPPTTTTALLISDRVKQEIEMDLLNEAFDNYMRIANALMKTLKRPKDRELCSDLLKRVQTLNGSQRLHVKRYNNGFFRYLLRILKYTSESQSQDLYRRLFNLNEDTEISDDNTTGISSWLSDDKIYLALKSLKDGTLMIYVAVASEANNGWQDGGLSILDKKATCARFQQQ